MAHDSAELLIPKTIKKKVKKLVPRTGTYIPVFLPSVLKGGTEVVLGKHQNPQTEYVFMNTFAL